MVSTEHPELRIFIAISRFCSRRAWLVIGFWFGALGVLNLSIPQLEQTVAAHSVSLLPTKVHAVQVLSEMSRDFKIPVSSGLGNLIFVDEQGISDADRRAYQQLVDKLRADTKNVAYVLDTSSKDAATDIGLSPDRKAIDLMIAATGDAGSIGANQNTLAIRAMADTLEKPPGLHIYYTGPSPTLADIFTEMDSSLLIITAVSVVVITLVLLYIYRSVITAMIPLITLGVALGVSRPVVSLLGMTGTLEVSNFTIALMTAIVLGATTDYAIFILAAYHEGRRKRLSVHDSSVFAVSKVNGILVGSTSTIAAAAISMGFAELGLFRASGPPVVVAIIMVLAVALSLPYALISVLGERGYIEPRRLNERRWQRLGAKVIRRSGVLTTACLIFLITAAAVLVTYRGNFDESTMFLDHPDSVAGYDQVYRHWGVNDATPEFVIVHADHDMRNTKDLAALEHVASEISAMPEVAYVRFLTRPAGKQLQETTIGYQTGIIANRLGEAYQHVEDSKPDLARLAGGVTQLHDGAAAASTQLPALVNGVRQLGELARSVLAAYQSAIDATHTATGADINQVLADMSSSLELVDRTLSIVADDGLALTALAGANSAIGPALTPECLANPVCMRARASLGDLDAMSNGAVSRVLRQMQAMAALPADALSRAHAGVQSVRTSLVQLRSMLGQTQGRSPQQAVVQLNELVRGTEQLSGGMAQFVDGLAQVQHGVGQVVDQSGRLGDGLKQAADYLQLLSSATSGGAGAGFYLPPQGFSDEKFKAAEQLLFSRDGRAARMMVAWKINPYSPQAFDAARRLANVATGAASTTSLDHARFAATGLASLMTDTDDQQRHDFALCIIGAIVGVLIVLIGMLRSIVAPVFMVSVVALSFAAVAGVSVIVWQYLLGIDIDWCVMPVAFMALIAVGADYSMLFAARIREESQGSGMIRGIIRGFGSTGGVITSAGVVFALTMFALMSGRVIELMQVGFMVGVGLLIDISVVRTVLVPAAMALIGDRIWWPAKRA
jgi:RND superfamily putative drug exporter